MFDGVSSQALRPDRKRELVDGVIGDWQVSERRACDALRFDRSSHRVIDRRFSYKGPDVVAKLEEACWEEVCGKLGHPKTTRADNGSEFVSPDMDLWAYQNGVTLDFSRPGKPTDNAFIEAFNSKL